MRRLITAAALASACLVSSPAMLWAEQYEQIPGIGRIMTTSGGKVYCHPEKESLCTADELKKIEAYRHDSAIAKTRTATCVHACEDAAVKCEKPGGKPMGLSCGVDRNHCIGRC